MRVPAKHEVIEAPLTTFWFDGDGMLHGISRNELRNLESMKKNIVFLRTLLKGKKVYVILNVSNSSVYDREARNHFRNEVADIYKAIALVADSPVGRTVALFLSAITPDEIPVSTFTNRAD